MKMQLIDLLPEYYKGSTEVRAIQDALNEATTKLREDVDSFLAQLDLNTATWSLPLWEKAVGLPSNPAMPLRDRRNMVSGRLVGTAPATPEHLQGLASSLAKCPATVIEYPDEYRIVIKFDNEIGGLLYLGPLTDALKACLPAHIQFSYDFRYILWSEAMERYPYWEDIDGLTWQEIGAAAPIA